MRTAQIPEVAPTTPNEINENVRRLCRKIGIDGEPVFVPVTPRPGCVMNECFGNVASLVRANGGSAQHGWMIWEGTLLIEATFHCVWRAPNGELLDITPLEDNEQRILFLPDQTRVFTGTLVDNVRLPLVWDARTLALLFMGEEMHNWKVSKYPLRHGTLTAAEQIAMRKRVKSRIEGYGPDSECLCGSGNTFEHCHMPRLRR